MRALSPVAHRRLRLALMIAAAIVAGPILLAMIFARASDARR